MANKKTTGTAVEKVEASTPVEVVVSPEQNTNTVPAQKVPGVAPTIADGVVFTKTDIVPSSIWNVVENATDMSTFAMNLPSGVMIAVFANNVGSMQYVAGIHYDVTAKRFSV